MTTPLSSVHVQPTVYADPIDYSWIDYLPIISAIKAVVDYIALHYWHPDVATLSPYASAYYHHISEKSEVRYLAAVPFFGNLFIILVDMSEQSLIARAEQGDGEAIDTLMQGTPRERAKAIEYCFALGTGSSQYSTAETSRSRLLPILCDAALPDQERVLHWFLENTRNFSSSNLKELYNTDHLPNELRVKIRDVFLETALEGEFQGQMNLRGIFPQEDQAGKEAIIRTLFEHAERGNPHAYDLLVHPQNAFLTQSDTPPELKESIFQWMIRLAEEQPSHLISDKVWESLQTLLSYDNFERERIIQLHCRVIQLPGISQERFSNLRSKLESIRYGRDAVERIMVLACYVALAQNGNAIMQRWVSTYFQYVWHELPSELRVKIRDLILENALAGDPYGCYDIHVVFNCLDQEGKDVIIRTLSEHARRGNAHAYGLLAGNHNAFLMKRDTSPEFKERIFQWMIRLVEEHPSHSLADKVWESLQTLSNYNFERERIIRFYCSVLQIQGISQERFDYLFERLERICLRGTQVEKVIVFTCYMALAQRGNLSMMHKIAQHLECIGNTTQSVYWFKKAAHGDHVPSMLYLGRYYCRNNIDVAIFWLEKTSGRNHEATELLQTLYRIKTQRQEFERARAQAEQARARAEAEFQSRSQRTFGKGSSSQKSANNNAPPPRRQMPMNANSMHRKLEEQGFLGVKFSTNSELNKAFHKFALVNHPDKFANEADKKKAEKKFKTVANLVTALKDYRGWPK